MLETTVKGKICALTRYEGSSNSLFFGVEWFPRCANFSECRFFRALFSPVMGLAKRIWRMGGTRGVRVTIN